MENYTMVKESILKFFKNHFGNISSKTFGLLAILLAHFSSIPTLIAVLLGKSDTLPPVDLVLFVWASLVAMFFKSLIEKNNLYVTVISIGFAAQAIIMSLILFK
jgi:hypothetical protein